MDEEDICRHREMMLIMYNIIGLVRAAAAVTGEEFFVYIFYKCHSIRMKRRRISYVKLFFFFLNTWPMKGRAVGRVWCKIRTKPMFSGFFGSVSLGSKQWGWHWGKGWFYIHRMYTDFLIGMRINQQKISTSVYVHVFYTRFVCFFIWFENDWKPKIILRQIIRIF